MKDYTMNKEEKNMFILNYKIKKNNIIIRLASKEKYIVPYTEENEKIILDRMKEQVTENIDFEKEASKEYIILTLFTIALAFTTVLLMGKYLPSLISHPTLKTLISNIPSFIGLGLTSISALFSVSAQETLEDFRKNKLYLNKEEELNEKINNNQNLLSNVSTKTKKMVETATEDKPVFDINKIDKVTLKDLKQLLENFKRDEEFGFDYTKTKKLIKK